MKRKLPLLFIVVLLILGAFMAGNRYGQEVEKANKILGVLLSITPSPSIVPTEIGAQDVSYQEVTLKECGISFLVPEIYTGDLASDEAVLKTSDRTTGIEVSCNPRSSIASIMTDEQDATTEVQLNEKEVTASVGAFLSAEDTKFYAFVIESESQNNSVRVIINERLLPLFIRTLKIN
jgi:hypothetical protein